MKFRNNFQKNTVIMKIIDCHQHVNMNGYDADKLIAHLDKIGISKAWLLTRESIDGSLDWGYQHHSIDEVYEAYMKYPDRFIPFYAPDPRREGAENILRRWVKKSIRGYGEMKIRACIDNPDSLRMYKLCADLNLPVLIHISVPLSGDRRFYNPDVDGLERVLKRYPQTTFIGHGPGFWREISGDVSSNTRDAYPEGKVKSGGKIPQLLETYSNLYADISAGSGLNALTRDDEFGLLFIRKHYPKLLYGTDCQDRRHLDFLRSLELNEEMFTAITYNNAAKLVPV